MVRKTRVSLLEYLFYNSGEATLKKIVEALCLGASIVLNLTYAAALCKKIVSCHERGRGGETGESKV